MTVLDDRTDRDLVAWSRAWVEEGGRPTIETHLTPGAAATAASIGSSSHSPIRAAIGSCGGPRSWTCSCRRPTGLQSLPVELGDERVEVAAARGLSRVAFVLPTGGGLGYGNFVLDADSRRELLRRVPELKDPRRARCGVGDALGGDARSARRGAGVRRRRAAGAAARGRPAEREPAGRLLARRLLAVPARRPSASVWRRRSRRSCATGWLARRRASAKATYFNGFRSMVSTPGGVAFLERVWAHQEKIPGLTLAEPDEADDGARPRGAWRAERRRRFSRSSAARFTNPDRKARFEFVMPALAASAGDARRDFSPVSPT